MIRNLSEFIKQGGLDRNRDLLVLPTNFEASCDHVEVLGIIHDMENRNKIIRLDDVAYPAIVRA